MFQQKNNFNKKNGFLIKIGHGAISKFDPKFKNEHCH